MTARAEILEVLIEHCRLLAKTRDPRRRVAAAEMEIELRARLAALRLAPVAKSPGAASHSRRDKDPASPAEEGGT